MAVLLQGGAGQHPEPAVVHRRGAHAPAEHRVDAPEDVPGVAGAADHPAAAAAVHDQPDLPRHIGKGLGQLRRREHRSVVELEAGHAAGVYAVAGDVEQRHVPGRGVPEGLADAREDAVAGGVQQRGDGKARAAKGQGGEHAPQARDGVDGPGAHRRHGGGVVLLPHQQRPPSLRRGAHLHGHQVAEAAVLRAHRDDAHALAEPPQHAPAVDGHDPLRLGGVAEARVAGVAGQHVALDGRVVAHAQGHPVGQQAHLRHRHVFHPHPAAGAGPAGGVGRHHGLPRAPPGHQAAFADPGHGGIGALPVERARVSVACLQLHRRPPVQARLLPVQGQGLGQIPRHPGKAQAVEARRPVRSREPQAIGRPRLRKIAEQAGPARRGHGFPEQRPGPVEQLGPQAHVRLGGHAGDRQGAIIPRLHRIPVGIPLAGEGLGVGVALAVKLHGPVEAAAQGVAGQLQPRRARAGEPEGVLRPGGQAQAQGGHRAVSLAHQRIPQEQPGVGVHRPFPRREQPQVVHAAGGRGEAVFHRLVAQFNHGQRPGRQLRRQVQKNALRARAGGQRQPNGRRQQHQRQKARKEVVSHNVPLYRVIGQPLSHLR